MIAKENQGWKIRKTNGQSKEGIGQECLKSAEERGRSGKKWTSVRGKKIQIEEE